MGDSQALCVQDSRLGSQRSGQAFLHVTTVVVGKDVTRLVLDGAEAVAGDVASALDSNAVLEERHLCHLVGAELA